MENTTVDFVLVASSSGNCFSFLDCLWWYQMLTPSDLRLPALRLSGIYCLWLSPSVVNLVTLHSAVRLKHRRAGAESFLGSGAIVSRQAAASCRGVVCLSRISAAVWGLTQHQDPSGYSLSSLPKASVSSPLCPSLSLPEPQVSGCK